MQKLAAAVGFQMKHTELEGEEALGHREQFGGEDSMWP